jgi:hypothetical protein
MVAYEHFMRIRSIPRSKKQIQNYDVLFQSSERAHLVDFVPRWGVYDPRVDGGVTDLGHGVHYQIRKADYKIIRWNLHE